MFLFKKIVAPLFFPLSIGLSVYLVGVVFLWFTRRPKAGKIFVSVAFAFLLFISYGIISDVPLTHLENKYPPLTDLSDYANVKWVVVLGGGHTSDPKLPANSQISSPSLMRLVEGIRIYKNIPESKMILSGGKGFDPVPNAKIMAKVALVLGVQEKDIVLEQTSKDTKDEALLIKMMVHEDDFILVSTASHMPRAMAMFKKLNMRPIPAPTDYSIKDGSAIAPISFFPRSSKIHNAEKAFYEYLAIAWAKLKGQI